MLKQSFLFYRLVLKAENVIFKYSYPLTDFAQFKSPLHRNELCFLSLLIFRNSCLFNISFISVSCIC